MAERYRELVPRAELTLLEGIGRGARGVLGVSRADRLAQQITMNVAGPVRAV